MTEARDARTIAKLFLTFHLLVNPASSSSCFIVTPTMSAPGPSSASSGKRKKHANYVTLNLDHLLQLFGSDDASASSSAASSTSASSAPSSSSSLPKKCVDLAYIRAAYKKRDSDMQKTIDDLVEATGLHTELHSRVAFEPTMSEEEKKSEDDHSSSYSSSMPPSSANPLKKQRSSAFTIEQIQGDLFTSPSSSSLAHCVSTDLAMGKGIALLFKQRFGGLAELKSQHQTVGGCAVLQKDGRYIYYLITKPLYFNKPTYATLEQSLQTMRSHMISHGVKLVSMPRIGCGLDGLLWNQVAQAIKKVFADDHVKIVVYTM